MKSIITRIKTKALENNARIIRRLRSPQKYKTLGFLLDYLENESIIISESGEVLRNVVISQICTILSPYFPKKCACLVYRNPIYKDEDLERYADLAIQKGAAVLITDKPFKNYPCIVSDNPLEVYARLCRYYRDLQQKVSITAVTGSIGKSTVSSMIGHVYLTKTKTAFTEVNANALKSVGFAAQHIPNDVELMVHEIAESEPGETQYLAEILHPDVFVITAIDSSHLEHFGSVERIAEEICSATKHISENGFVVVNKDEFQRYELLNGRKAITVSCKDSEADFFCKNIIINNEGITFEVCVKSNGYCCNVVLHDIFAAHNVSCALMAFAAGWLMGVKPNDIVKGLADYRTKGVRQNVLRTKDEVLIYADCYNAIGRSMKSAITTCDKIPVKGKRIAVLGDVEEVGEMAESMHHDIVAYVNDSSFDVFLTIGNKMRKAVESTTFRESLLVQCCNSIDELATIIKEIVQKDDLVLFKSSHSYNLDKCILKVWPDLKNDISEESYDKWMRECLFW